MKLSRLLPTPSRRALAWQRGNDRSLGVRHEHVWTAVRSLPELQSAHDRMRWDVATGRILSVNICSVCNELDRDSIEECTTRDCTAHSICARPYR